MAVNLIPDSSSFIVSDANGDTIKLYSLSGDPAALSHAVPGFILNDDAIITGDLHANATFGTQIFSAGGFQVEDLTTHDAPFAVNQANFNTPGLGVTEQALLPGTHDIVVMALKPNAFMETGSGNDTLVALSGTNILDGGTGVNTYYGGAGQNTFIADARTTNATMNLENMKLGDNAIIAGTFTSVFEGITPSGVDFQFIGANGQPSAEVIMAGVTNTANYTVGISTANPTGVPYAFISDTPLPS